MPPGPALDVFSARVLADMTVGDGGGDAVSNTHFQYLVRGTTQGLFGTRILPIVQPPNRRAERIMSVKIALQAQVIMLRVRFALAVLRARFIRHRP